MSRNNGATHYELLGVSNDASTEAIHAAWRRRIAAVHPDHATGQADEVLRTADAIRLNSAWATLGNATRRADYDLEIARAYTPDPTPAWTAPTPAYTTPQPAWTAPVYRYATPAPQTASLSKPSNVSLQGMGLLSFALAGAFLTTFAALPFALPAAVVAVVLGLAGFGAAVLDPSPVRA